MDGSFTAASIGQHLNVNVADREMLLDRDGTSEKNIRSADHPCIWLQYVLTDEEQRQDVITRTFTQTM